MMMKPLPFQLQNDRSFTAQMSDWIADRFYDVFPEHGLEVRDEQVFMAYQLEKAFEKSQIILAEAGVGTGKTLVYLLYAICYARYKGKPAIIACADETLIEQLVKKEGDIKKLNDILGLDIDVRLAKSEDQYLCLKKLYHHISEEDENEALNAIYDGLPGFIFDDSLETKFHPYGDRKDYKHFSDAEWAKTSWDPFLDCFSCDHRHRCGQTLSRDHYRKATDLIVCSHDFFMKHLWTEDSRKREGQLPYLPPYSSVILDEGHLLEYAAQKALTYALKEDRMTHMFTRLAENEIQSTLAYLIEETLSTVDELFDSIYDVLGNMEIVEGERIYVPQNELWLSKIAKLKAQLEEMGDQLVFESELYTIDAYELNIIDGYLDELVFASNLLLEGNVIYWAEMKDGYMQMIVMPHFIQDFMKKHVWSKKIPYVFSSATLSNAGNFTYFKKSLGIEEALQFSVESPYDYEEKMQVFFHITDEKEKMRAVMKHLQKSNGRTLLLFPTGEQLKVFHKAVQDIEHPFEILFEGDQEISTLVSYFQNHEHTILCAEHLWEGLDVPGSSLSQVIIWDLPFPPKDPVFDSFRKAAEDAFIEVDLPYMLLRIRQGIGRLIRNEDDHGDIVIFFDAAGYEEYHEYVEEVLPKAATVLK